MKAVSRLVSTGVLALVPMMSSCTDRDAMRSLAAVAPAPVPLPFNPPAVAALAAPLCRGGCVTANPADPLLCIQPITGGICLGFNVTVGMVVSTISYYNVPAGGCGALVGQACTGFMPSNPPGVAIFANGTIPNPITQCGGNGDLCCNPARAGAQCVAGLNCVPDAAGINQFCQPPGAPPVGGGGGIMIVSELPSLDDTTVLNHECQPPPPP